MKNLGGKIRENSRNNNNENGSSTALVISLIFAILVALSAGAFGVWSYLEMTKYKDESNQKTEIAVKEAKESTTSSVTEKLNAEFEEKYKQPFSTFVSPGMFGTVTFQYPKTWAQFIQSNENQFAGYFFPLAVPPIKEDTAYALRVKIVPQKYAQVLQSYQSNVKNGKLTSSTLNTGVDSSAKGMLLKGQFSSKINGSVAVFPVLNGNYTLQIFSDNHDFESDFVNTILPTLKYDL